MFFTNVGNKLYAHNYYTKEQQNLNQRILQNQIFRTMWKNFGDQNLKK